VGYLAGFWKFSSRPSLTDTPACGKLPPRKVGMEMYYSTLTEVKLEKKSRYGDVKYYIDGVLTRDQLYALISII